MPVPIPQHCSSSAEQIERQYRFEREWSERLKSASVEERRGLYTEAYQALNKLLPENPQLQKKENTAARSHEIALQIQLLLPFISASTAFLEVGGGDCRLAAEVSPRVRSVVAVEASEEAARGVSLPENTRLLVKDSIELELEDGSIDLAFSCHFIEHLHPEDALAHLREMGRVLRRGGGYICVTPNRLYGPHDVSKYFDDVPKGLHLKEYSTTELAALFSQAGFTQINALRGIGKPAEPCRLEPHKLAELLLSGLPQSVRRTVLSRIGGAPPFRPLEQVKLLGKK